MKVKLSKDRLYYTISDVARMLDLKASVIRFWEKEFADVKPVQRRRNSKRKYKFKDIQYIYRIKELLYYEKYTIKGAIEQLKSWKPEYSLEELCALIENKNPVSFNRDEESLIDSDLVVVEKAFSGSKSKIVTADSRSEILLTKARIKVLEIKKLLKRLK